MVDKIAAVNDFSCLCYSAGVWNEDKPRSLLCTEVTEMENKRSASGNKIIFLHQ